MLQTDKIIVYYAMNLSFRLAMFQGELILNLGEAPSQL